MVELNVGKAKKGFLNLFSEDNGHLSTIRIIMFFITFVVLGNWTWFNIANNTLSVFDWSDLMVILGPMMAKVWQKGKEQNIEK